MKIPQSNWVQLGCAALIAVVLGGIASKYIVYSHPKVETTVAQKRTETVQKHTNIVKTTTTTTPTREGPITTVVVEKDLTTEDTSTVASTLSTSLSTPVFPPGHSLYLMSYKDVIGGGWLFGAEATPLWDIGLGVMTTEQLNKWYLGVKVPLR